jgi:16S rRNA (cytidine1402-2'-O)-methyltransferase
LTKVFEEIVRGPAREVVERYREPPKGEITLVLGPSAVDSAAPGESAAIEAVAELVTAGAARRAAADVVARLTGLPRNRLYRSSL